MVSDAEHYYESGKTTAGSWRLVSAVFWVLVRKKFSDDERKFSKWKSIVSRFKGKFVKIIKDTDGSFDEYSISPMIKQVLLRWGYELVENDLKWFIFC